MSYEANRMQTQCCQWFISPQAGRFPHSSRACDALILEFGMVLCMDVFLDVHDDFLETIVCRFQ